MAVVAGWKVDRGRVTEMDRVGTGTATVTMIDTNHSVDPASGGSIPPGTPVALGLGGFPVFTGYARKHDYDLYQDGTYGTATLDCEDGFGVLTRTEMYADQPVFLGQAGKPAWGDEYAQLTKTGTIKYAKAMQVKHRIDRILDQARWPAGLREVFTGNIRLLATKYAAGQGALAAIWDAAEAEFPGISNCFISKDGLFVFHGRLARFNPTDPQYRINTWLAGDLPNASGRAVITGLGPYGPDGDRIINTAQCFPEGILEFYMSDQKVVDSASVSTHGVRPWSAENLIIDHSWLTGQNGRDECRSYAQYYIDNYSEANIELRRLQLKWLPPGTANATATNAMMAQIDISDRVHLLTANGFNDYYFVEGLHYDAKPASNQYHEVTLDIDLSPATHWETPPS
jgi:hypothetical protein